jgi:manganese/zinc/iron transport system substrate-binding protein
MSPARLARPPRNAAGVLAGFALSLLAAFVGLAAPGCERAPAPARSGLNVVATTGMVADAVRAVAGPRARVAALMGEGVDPHLYKASPGDVRALSDADAIFYSGLLLEGRMVDVLVKLAARKPTFAVTESIDPAQLREPPEFHGHPDPHVWFDVSLWMKAVERARDGLAQIDPPGRPDYTANAERYLGELRQLHDWCRQRLASLPPERRVLVTAHDAFGYFGRAYGLEVLAIQGISTDSEASLKDVNALVDLLVTRKIPAVFVESSVPRKTIDALVEGAAARGHTVRIGGELFSDALGREGTPEGTYIGMVRHNVNTIVDALAGPASPVAATTTAPPTAAPTQPSAPSKPGQP